MHRAMGMRGLVGRASGLGLGAGLLAYSAPRAHCEATNTPSTPSHAFARVSVETWGGDRPITHLGGVRAILKDCGATVDPLPLSGEPDSIRALLAKDELTQAEQDIVKNHFLMKRDKLVSFIKSVRKPHVSDGGAMETSHKDGSYPAFYCITPPGMSSQPFEQLHVNTADDGTGVDEVMQVVKGSCVWYFTPTAESGGGPPVKVTVSASDELAWRVTYNGANPHAGTLQPLYWNVAQAVGPKTWTMRFLDDAPNPWVTK